MGRKLGFATVFTNITRKGALPDGTKSMGKKLGFSTVFTNITRKGALPNASIYTVEMTAI